MLPTSGPSASSPAPILTIPGYRSETRGQIGRTPDEGLNGRGTSAGPFGELDFAPLDLEPHAGDAVKGMTDGAQRVTVPESEEPERIST